MIIYWPTPCYWERCFCYRHFVFLCIRCLHCCWSFYIHRCNLLSEHLLTHLRTEKSFARISALACAPPLKLLSLRWFFNYMPADKIMVDESPIKCVWVILSYRPVCGISDFSFHTLMEFMTSLMEVRLTPPFIPFQLPPLYASNVKVQR